MDKRIKIEGSFDSRMIQLMRKYGHNREMKIEVATVLTPAPNLTLRMPSDGLQLEREELILTATAASRNLASGDSVIVIADEDSQMYFVMDKAVI
ncbi:hypothetical protein [Peribacillus huizhouensis]|uniref:DUF2577 domain-containing protein n=1 Tax=Peribacillus huizhouensis TaxID=1501239 RepID=A0ABR6CR54_9BACI|nr:hypothetical protein [Peribacillus huizhouensis]MBA9027511.1 hypothetical protein [Peribacillus huizhouensis]